MPAKIKISKKELQNLLDIHKTARSVSKAIGCCERTIQVNMKNYSLKRPIANGVNHEFFQTWSEHMSYILGFIIADGNVGKYKPYLNIELSSKDEEILNYIKSHIQPPANIYRYQRILKKTGNPFTSSKIMIYSRQILKDLEKFNVVPNKTGNHPLDYNIPKQYQRDFVRGFFDGDGSIFYRYGLINSKFVCIDLQFINSIQKMIGNIGSKHIYKGLHDITIFYKDSLKLRDYMYYDGCFSLQRKKDRFFNSNIKEYKSQGWETKMKNLDTSKI